jgi:hypothetical protein
MKRTWVPAVILVLIGVGQPAWGVDLSKVERTITQEPAYQTKRPQYGLLVFGPDARARVWLVLDGTVLYVDRTGKGDLTGPEKRVKNASPKNAKVAHFYTGPIIAADGKTKYPNVLVRVRHEGRVNHPAKVFVQAILPAEFQAARADRQRGGEQGELLFAARPQDAPVLHFDGPLTFGLEDPKQVFVRGVKPTPLPVLVGTPGLGQGTFTALVFDAKAPAAVAEIAFPTRKAGDKPIVVQVPLQPPD